MKNDETARMISLLARALRAGGDTHTVEDILIEINAGKKQSFVHGSTWAITQVLDFPRKRVLELFMVVGKGCELALLEDRIVQFAKDIGADFIRTQGRTGWRKRAKEMGWEHTHSNFVKRVK
jgi:hypothetical protein